MTEKKKFPKPTGRIGKGLANTLKPVIEDAEVVSEEKPMPKAVPLEGFVKINVSAKGSHIEIDKLNIVQALQVMKAAHRYLYNELKKEMDKLNGIEEGTADSTSRGDS